MIANQEAIAGFQDLLSLLSKRDNLKMFMIAKEGQLEEETGEITIINQFF
jgi:hypothetical protein